MKILLPFMFITMSFISNSLNGQVGIGTITPEPSSVLDISATDKGLLIPRVSLDNVATTQLDGVNTAIYGLLIWNTNATTVGGSGIGFYYFNAPLAIWQRLSSQNVDAENGLNLTGTAVRLGGSLLENTTITNGAFDFDVNLTDLGDFHVQDNGINHFSIESTGIANFGGDVFWNDESTTGTVLASLVDSGNDGRFRIYENGNTSIDLNANGTSVINEQGLDRDFRIESDNNPLALGVNGGENVMFAGTNTLSLTNNGATINGVTLEYVASFYRDDLTNGTAIQLGSTEHITDFGNLIIGPYGAWAPYSDNTFDLGTPTFRWDDVYATSGIVNTSDIRLKKNIKNLSYGLDEVLKLEPISYQWKNARDPSEVKIGFSAQQLLTVLPEVVKTHEFVYPDENGPGVLQENERLGVYYSDIIPVLTKAIQEQQLIIEKLEKRIETLEKQ